MTPVTVSRWLRGFDTRGELEAEYRLPDSWTTERLRNLFGADDKDPMFDSYPLGPVQARVLGNEIGKDLSSGEFEFFLEADAEE